ncbi:uncharacterized protein LOC120359756 [Solenopsis invicta]|uniref:uncharacterized protein LOC120358405 n=2 Tax=Solenopsis invicta TaxID=13686 RepID=UPI00193CDD2B|nr:uncharacterized protein LOC120358405 [Solenopsis invicta]XP_039308552.1 uncharacterized protein LOC120358405 [Solenopsis invicta]XP_039310125.1 uncharacterized protein LOC120358797 [Solenopsis invicta]XP_039310126.1 uncharacterized protein LOC120358797 [Solenopsis invicta]XP_039314603.1 uncharacterized protein LOC120359756 [Solenopsis invicta]
MGKSDRKSRKRKRSESRDRFAGLEDKLSHLIEILSRSEVRVPRGSSSLSFSQSEQTSQEVREVSDEETSRVSLKDESDNDPESISIVRERLKDPHVSATVINPSTEESPSSPPPANAAAPASTGPDEVSVDLSKDLFGPDSEATDLRPWNNMVSQKWTDLTRKGLPTSQREVLLKKYSPPEDFAFLRAPKLNLECKSALKNNVIVKRDEYSCLNQNQVGTALFALGEAISDLLRPEIQQFLNPDVRMAISKIADGAQLLADLFYRLSLSRRALIKPAFNTLAKSTADAIPADNFLFGSSFGEEIKKATSMEKSARDIVSTSLTISKRVQQPIKLPAQTAPSTSGNSRAPASKTKPSATRRTGASSSSRRSSVYQRSRSRRR